MEFTKKIYNMEVCVNIIVQNNYCHVRPSDFAMAVINSMYSKLYGSVQSAA